MEMTEARGWAAQCWTTSENAKTEMDPKLAEAFAHCLLDRLREAERAQLIGQAMDIYRRVLGDPEAFLSYARAIGGGVFVDLPQAALYTPKGREAAAARVLRLLFWTPDAMPAALDALVTGLEHQAGWRRRF